MTPERVTGVLETSFWTAACRAEVAANCLDLFQIVVPRAVEREIRHSPDPTREFPYATLFRHLRDRMQDPPADAPPPLSLFGPGEAEAITLAIHLKARLLMNEHRATRFASAQGVRVVSVPAVIVRLCDQETISRRAANRKLDLIEPITNATLIEDARELLDLL